MPRRPTLAPDRLPHLVAAIVFSLAALAVSPVTAADGLQVSKGDGAWIVSGNLDNAPLGPVLASLAEKTGFSLRQSPRLPQRQVSLTASQRPLPATLAALLAGTEHAIEFDADGRVSAVYLCAEGEEATDTTAGSHDSPAPAIPPPLLPSGSASATMQAALAATAASPSSEDVDEVFRQRDAIFAEFVERYGKSLPPHLIEQARRTAHGDRKQ